MNYDSAAHGRGPLGVMAGWAWLSAGCCFNPTKLCINLRGSWQHWQALTLMRATRAMKSLAGSVACGLGAGCSGESLARDSCGVLQPLANTLWCWMRLMPPGSKCSKVRWMSSAVGSVMRRLPPSALGVSLAQALYVISLGLTDLMRSFLIAAVWVFRLTSTSTWAGPPSDPLGR